MQRVIGAGRFIAITTIGVFLTASINAHAKPVYLECHYVDSEGAVNNTVTVDEETGRVVHKIETGLTFKADGFFEANEITYKHLMSLGGGLMLESLFKINRETLAFERINTAISPDYPQLNESYPANTGKCKIIKTQKRKL